MGCGTGDVVAMATKYQMCSVLVLVSVAVLTQVPLLLLPPLPLQLLILPLLSLLLRGGSKYVLIEHKQG